MTWYDRLNDCLEKRGWSKTEMSKRSGVPYSNLLKYCSGKVQQPRGPIVEQLAEALDADPVWLLTGRGDNSGAEMPTSPAEPTDKQSAFNLAVKVADEWELELFGEANIVAHTTLVTHLYQYIVKHGIKTQDDAISANVFSYRET
ncbi:MAG: helix-turn-helix transcriptional regulator [Alphaproteobacteria bacterium]|nr:helix-turn-helix transcriptional regulator [Alphaproteobacteria bacterium]